MSCKICGREADIGRNGEAGLEMCKRHSEAERMLKEHFKIWAERTGIGWPEYLEAIVENEKSGTRVKEAAIYLLRNGL